VTKAKKAQSKRTIWASTDRIERIKLLSERDAEFAGPPRWPLHMILDRIIDEWFEARAKRKRRAA
jgi:hypothetical protein